MACVQALLHADEKCRNNPSLKKKTPQAASGVPK